MKNRSASWILTILIIVNLVLMFMAFKNRNFKLLAILSFTIVYLSGLLDGLNKGDDLGQSMKFNNTLIMVFVSWLLILFGIVSFLIYRKYGFVSMEHKGEILANMVMCGFLTSPIFVIFGVSYLAGKGLLNIDADSDSNDYHINNSSSIKNTRSEPKKSRAQLKRERKEELWRQIDAEIEEDIEMEDD